LVVGDVERHLVEDAPSLTFEHDIIELEWEREVVVAHGVGVYLGS
jgi:hypothetical protein